MASILNSHNRSLSAPTFMPDGLYLAKIEYDKKWQLPQKTMRNLPGALPDFDV
jgi:tRNA pseudouridine38-40 synthase